MPPPGYLRIAVETLAETGAADVGGVMAAEGVSTFQRRGLGHDVQDGRGLGRLPHRRRGRPGAVYLGVYRREAIEQAGGWDETMLRAEDWDLNYRIRARGGVVWFTPALRVTYRPRASVRALAAQYFHYGRWRRVIVREHPRRPASATSPRPWRRAWSPLGVAGVAGLAGLAAGAPAGVRWLTLGLVIPVTYLAGVTAAGAALTRGLPAAVRLRVPLVLGIMHMAWGAGFLTSPGSLHRPFGPEPDTHVGEPDAAGTRATAAGRRMDHGLRPRGTARGPSHRRL